MESGASLPSVMNMLVSLRHVDSASVRRRPGHGWHGRPGHGMGSYRRMSASAEEGGGDSASLPW